MKNIIITTIIFQFTKQYYNDNNINDLNIVSSKCAFSRGKIELIFWSKLQLLRAVQLVNVLIIYQYDYNIIIMELKGIIMIIITE